VVFSKRCKLLKEWSYVKKKNISLFQQGERCCQTPFIVLQSNLHNVLLLSEFAAMNITVADVEHVARLARLELGTDEKNLFAVQMDAILGYVEQLKELNTDGIVPTSHAVPMENAFREDRAQPSIGIEKALANAPDRVESFFRVPKVIE
jgi:aspartyl-tRNA(Asn)/glutamyl-tRNA(Gln) amidotransferase subunit C